MLQDEVYLGENISTVSKNDKYVVLEMKSDTGEGRMKCYEVFQGIILAYNDFHMESCHSKFKAKKDIFTIEHCREGRVEWDLGNDSYMYLEAGDVRLDTHTNHHGKFEFPSRHYHGISILFYGDEAENSLKNALFEFPVDLKRLQEKFCKNDKVFIFRSKAAFEHIFAELYAVPKEVKEYYLKIKVLELLLYLSALDVSGILEKHPYFYKVQVEKIKAMEKFMTLNIEKHYTLNQLSEKFDIALTSMKTCFKGVYGDSIYSYMRNYRINRAAVMLRKTQDSIVSIAGAVGYDSHSKFSAAFKKIMGKSPLEYRKSIV